MTELLKIEVPFLPPVEYSPNWRGHWAQRYKAGEEYSDAVYYYAIDARNRFYDKGLFLQFQKACIDLTFVFPDERTRDQDNLIARFKPGLDALVDSLILAGDDSEHLRIGAVTIEIDKDRAPLTIITLTEELKELKTDI